MTAHVEVWQDRDGQWRWRYLDPAPADGQPPRELLGNKHYPSRDLAVHAATTAYPGMEVHDRAHPASPANPPSTRRARRAGRARRRWLWRVLWVATVVVVALWPVLRGRWRKARVSAG